MNLFVQRLNSLVRKLKNNSSLSYFVGITWTLLLESLFLLCPSYYFWKFDYLSLSKRILKNWFYGKYWNKMVFEGWIVFHLLLHKEKSIPFTLNCAWSWLVLMTNNDVINNGGGVKVLDVLLIIMAWHWVGPISKETYSASSLILAFVFSPTQNVTYMPHFFFQFFIFRD